MGLGQVTGLQRPSPFTTRPLAPTSPFWAHRNLLSSKSPPHSTGLPPPPGQSDSESTATLLGLSAPRTCGWSRGDSPNPEGSSGYQAPDRPLFRPLFQTQTATRLECLAFVLAALPRSLPPVPGLPGSVHQILSCPHSQRVLHCLSQSQASCSLAPLTWSWGCHLRVHLLAAHSPREGPSGPPCPDPGSAEPPSKIQLKPTPLHLHDNHLTSPLSC